MIRFSGQQWNGSGLRSTWTSDSLNFYAFVHRIRFGYSRDGVKAWVLRIIQTGAGLCNANGIAQSVDLCRQRATSPHTDEPRCLNHNIIKNVNAKLPKGDARSQDA
ncbi:predicted protein [Coccidioides posadasii str. Silveira]|uniref:Predicted protein n=2 Tax=Coccidioides posadasii TaxID=199306 RepID=E9CUB0_COCPS|nr:predicted protein [Coccidioides posadasii str. Silveira]KMM67117.1 hypothetical protein CPAG_03453 [Coccidioides posadasii RMSCC 3488]